MITTVLIHRAEFLRPYSYELKNHQNFPRVSASWTMAMDSKPSQKGCKEEFSVEVPKRLVSQSETAASMSDLQFDRRQPPEEAFTKDSRIDFGRFTAREAVLDEEYWTAAWLRAESQWEDRTGERYVENCKRKFTEQEFSAIKRRCKSQLGHKSTCILAVKKEQMNVVNTVVKSVVGTLDLSIRHLLHGEAFPGERVKTPLFCSINKEGSRYGYVSNLCVAKSARRQGIASNMLSFAIRLAKENGAEQVLVHVHRNNRPAQELYQKMGFQVVEMATSQLAAEQTYLLCLRA